jgi:Zn finger protein HypA/HybF involved in hydrogenase expression
MEQNQKKYFESSSDEPETTISKLRKSSQNLKEELRRQSFAEKIKSQLKFEKEHAKCTNGQDTLAPPSPLKDDSESDRVWDTDRPSIHYKPSNAKTFETRPTDLSHSVSLSKKMLLSSGEMHKQVSQNLAELKDLKNSLDQLHAAATSKSRATLLEQILKEKLGVMRLDDVADSSRGCLLCGCSCGNSGSRKSYVSGIGSLDKAEVYSVNLSNMNLLKPCASCKVLYMASEKSTKNVCEACRSSRDDVIENKMKSGMCLLLRLKTHLKTQKNSAETPIRQKSEAGSKLKLRSVTPPKRRLPSINNPFVSHKDSTEFHEPDSIEIKVGSAKIPINLDYRTHFYKLILPMNSRLSLSESLNSSQRFQDNPITPSFKMKSHNELSEILSQVREEISVHTRKLSEETYLSQQPSRMKEFISQLNRLKSSGRQVSEVLSKLLASQIRRCNSSDRHSIAEICVDFYKKYLKLCLQLISDIAEILPDHTIALRNMIEGMVLLTDFSLSFYGNRYRESTLIIDSSLRTESIK